MDDLTRERFGPTIPWAELKQPPRVLREPDTAATTAARRAALDEALHNHEHGRWTAA